MKFPIIAVVLAAYLHRVFFDLFYCSEEKHHQSDPSQLRMQRTELSVLPPIPSKDKNIFNLTFKPFFRFSLICSCSGLSEISGFFVVCHEAVCCWCCCKVGFKKILRCLIFLCDHIFRQLL